MYFIVIMAFALVLSDQLPPDAINLFKGNRHNIAVWGPTVLLTWSAFYVPLALAWLARLKIRRQPAQAEHSEELAASSLSQWQLAIIIATGLTFAAGMLLTPWVPIVKSSTGLGLGRFPLVGDLVVLSPFLAGLVAVWIVFYPVELRIKGAAIASTEHLGPHPGSDQLEGHVSLTEYLIDKCRHQFLLVAAPMLLIVFAKHYTDMLKEVPRFRALRFNPGDAVLGVISFIILLGSPVLLRYIWSTDRLPDGPLRERFEKTCRRIGLRYREILLWRTHGMAANAAVMGFVPPLRYVLISDALLESMSDEEIEAVFGHEAGHVHHWHLPFFGVFAIVSMYIAGGAFLLLSPEYLNVLRDPAILQLLSLAVLMGMWLFGFGWLSRRFERQADLFGVRCMTPQMNPCSTGCPVHGETPSPGLCVSATSLFGRTLLKIADLNGIPRDAPSWRHGSIDSRCRLLERFTLDKGAVAQFDRSVTFIKVGLVIAALIGTILMLIIYVPGILTVIK
jgi:STE24 endopeptidase